MKNKYTKYAKISEKEFRAILRMFCLDLEARQAAEFLHLNRVTVNRIYTKLRSRIAALCEAESPFENGEIKLDESYFGARRVRGKRGRGVAGKTPVFGMLKRGEKVYTQIVKHCSIKELLPYYKGSCRFRCCHLQRWMQDYDGLVNYGYKKHYRVKHDYNVFADGINHINGIENFWGCAKSDWPSSGVYTNTRSIYTLKSVIQVQLQKQKFISKTLQNL